uniref:Consortin, connexin sorting protein n=1 Tax=Iconisemion striatum TaxID=60296 RepID=A0A1A7WIS8_9TELE
MGNKNTSLPRGPDAVQTLKQEALSDDVTGVVSTDDPQSLSPELLAALQYLREDDDDYCLLPQSLHQIAEAYSLKEDYQWAIQFLQLEKLYHERVLSNLTALQEDWESQLKEDTELTSDTDGISQKHIETLDHICRTHHRPAVRVSQETQRNSQTETQILQSSHKEANSCDGEEDQNTISESELSSSQMSQEEKQDGGEEAYEEGQEVEEEEQETPEEEVVKVEWPTGVPQASDKDLAKLSHTERNSSPDGLVSILKRRRASLDGLPPPCSSSSSISCSDKHNSKRKVHFSEPDDGAEQDEVGGDSCLILLLLCFLTVVISIGGTALYCTLVDTYSTICTDFSHNMDFYMSNVRGVFQSLGWLPSWT